MSSPHHDHQSSRPLSRRGYGQAALILAAAAISACSDAAIPTNPTLTAPDAINASSTKRKDPSKAPATLAWQATARQLVTTHPAVSPIGAVRVYALLGMAQYGAIVAADAARGISGSDADFDAFNQEDEGGRAQHETRRGAIDAASLAVLTKLFPDAATAAALQAQFNAELRDANGRTSQFLAGKGIGETMGKVMTDWGVADGFSAKWLPPKYMPWLQDLTKPAQWYQALPPVTIPPTPMSPPAGFQFPDMRPYFMTSAAQFRPPPPPEFESPAFNTALQQVRTIAASRTQAQIDAANFWNLPSGSPTALGYWDQQAATYIDEHNLGERSAAHILALANAAALDATIGCWEAKYTYVLLRPFQNPGGVGPNGTVFPTPNHPSYPSGHSCVSAAAATVLEAFFPEKAAELNGGVIAAGMSRVYAGIHYSFDIDAGQALGRSAAEWALNYDRTRGLLAAVGR